MSPAASHDASIIIVSYNTRALTEAAVIGSLQASSDAEIIVFDNASSDGSAEALGLLEASRLRVLISAQNLGFGAAANAAAREASGRFVIFLNSDAQLTSTALECLTVELRLDTSSPLVGARLVDPSGRIQASAGLLPSPGDLALRALGLHRVGAILTNVPLIGCIVRSSRTATEYRTAERAHEATATDMVSGACFAMTRASFLDIGGFDERFFMYFEDADLCRRATGAGIPIRYVPDAVVTHVGGASSSEDYHFGPYHARSMRQYLGKWYGPAGSVIALLLLWLRAIGFTLALRPQARRAWRALWAALTDEDPRR